jgi:hypothetical protein
VQRVAHVVATVSGARRRRRRHDSCSGGRHNPSPEPFMFAIPSDFSTLAARACRTVPLAALALTLGATSACDANVIEAQTLDLAITYDGEVYQAVIHFDAYDVDAQHVSGDDTCDFFTGNCGHWRALAAEVREDGGLLAGAQMEASSPDNASYDIWFERSDDDDTDFRAEAATHGVMLPHQDYVRCRIYGSEIGQRKECYYSTFTAEVVATRRRH